MPTKSPTGIGDIRCPKLGHLITFSYCEKEQGTLPCVRALYCWAGHFDVEGYFKERLSEEEWVRAFETPPKPKLVTLLELIEQAKKRGEKGDK